MELEGRIIANRYELLKKIGNGGMATVYKAKDMVLKRFVAIKILRDEFTTDQEFIRRFNIEAQAAASLAHPNIVSIYDVGTEDNIYYIVMELIQGKTLKQIIDEDGVLPWKWSLNIAIQIASALETAHKNNIIHRDIKPHNIIITEDGIAKVTDFGIAKAVSNSTITAFGTTIGSVHYFSPEHAKGGFTDAKSDIYSLGIVMYEMLTGRVPFDADTPVSIALKHMQEKPIPPIKLNPSIPFAINKIIMKAMEKDISLRYQNATELLKDLSLALKNPEGNFVKSNAESMQYTQRVPTLGEERKMENSENKNEYKEKTGGHISSKPTKAKRILMIAVIACIIILIPIIGFFGTQLILDAGQPKDVNLPNLIGKTYEETKELLKDTKITIETEEEFNEEVEAGKIFWQEPPYIEGYQVKENSNIKVKISKGTEMVTMKKVVGMKFEEAEALIENELHLKIEKKEETSKTVEAGVIIKQTPEEGEEVKTGSTVEITVSTGTGIKQLSVPYVIGDTEEDAKKKLKDLEVIIVYEEDTTKIDGRVLKQSIEAGTTVDEKTKITVTVNKIEPMKTGTIKLNLKSLLQNELSIPKDDNGNDITTVKLEIVVDDKDSVYYQEAQSRDDTDIIATVTGKGTVTIKVKVNGVVKYKNQFDLTVDDPVLVID